MKKIILIAMLSVSISASAQTFDLVRTINTYAFSYEDTAFNDGFTHAGTMIITEGRVQRNSILCKNDLCLRINKNQKITTVEGNDFVVLSDENDFELLTILSLHPTIIIMKTHTASGAVEIDEYKQR